jgi:Zn ribbon nucleic-acid-binding protein
MSKYKLANDARVLYLIDVLKDLYLGEWRFIHANDQRTSGYFLRDNIAWLQVDLNNSNDQFIKGRNCPQCAVDDKWSGWCHIDLCDDKNVRRFVKLIVGINCGCWRGQ